MNRLKSKNADLAVQRTRLNNLRSAGDIAAYNAPYQATMPPWMPTTRGRTLKNLIAQYNQLVATRNALALETQQLTNEISSQVSPVSK